MVNQKNIRQNEMEHRTGLGTDNMTRSEVVSYYRIKELEKTIASKQAKIDALMLEYCPDEMTDKQIAEWANSQKAPKSGMGSMIAAK